MLWIKSLHVISVIAWMAALLYLPRLLVYHADAEPRSDKSETFKVMERRLLRGIAAPAMGATWVFGLWTAYLLQAWDQRWLWAKLALVVCMSAFHGSMARWVREFAEDRNRRPAGFYRKVNEIPTVIMIAIVVLVIVKPF